MGRAKKQKASEAPLGATFDVVRTLALALPESWEGTSYGTPAFKVGKSMYVRLHQDGDAIVVKVDPDQREMLMKVDPETFFITDHYLNYPWVLVRLATVDPAELRDVLEQAWLLCAPKRLVSAFQNEARNHLD